MSFNFLGFRIKTIKLNPYKYSPYVCLSQPIIPLSNKAIDLFLTKLDFKKMFFEVLLPGESTETFGLPCTLWSF